MGTLEYWLVGLPREKLSDSSFIQVNRVVRKFADSKLGKFNIPDLRVGTLDHLMSATDNLKRLQEMAEILLGKLIHTSAQVMEVGRNAVDGILLVDGRSMEEYMKRFKWDAAKYPTHLTIKGIEELIEKQLVQTEEDMHKLHEEYTKAFFDLESVERLQKGSLLQRNVSLFVKKHDFVVDSEYLITALVAVSKSRYREWYNCYERIDREVVPRSSFLILEDDDFGLFTVTLFKRHLDIFKDRARELKFFVRDFIYDEDRIEKEKKTLFELRWRKQQLYEPLVKWLKANFSEIYIALLHVQALRINVESILRYGLPAKYFSVYICIPKKEASKLLEAMLKEYVYLDESIKSISDSSLITNEDIPFVYFKIRTEFSEFK